MRVRRLGWAGIEVEAEGQTVVVDLFEEVGLLSRFVGDARGPLLAPDAAGSVAAALVTHLHTDHTDAPAIARALANDGIVLRPRPAEGEGLETIGTAMAEAALAESGVEARVVEPWETVVAGPFELTAVPSADGFGDPQVGWVVAAGGRRIVHYGDTVFHGWWWLAKMRRGPFDAAFLPVNGAIVSLPHRQPASPLPAAMDPAQAAAAAAILEAREAVAIHYDTLHQAPTYVQVDEPAAGFEDAGAELGVRTRVVEPGEWFEVGG